MNLILAFTCTWQIFPNFFISKNSTVLIWCLWEIIMVRVCWPNIYAFAWFFWWLKDVSVGRCTYNSLLSNTQEWPTFFPKALQYPLLPWNMSHISKCWVPRSKISQVMSWKLSQLDSNLNNPYATIFASKIHFSFMSYQVKFKTR